MLKDKTLLLTGGHAGATAYALVQSLRKSSNYNFNIYFLGSKNATEGASSKTLEEESLPQLGVSFIGITTGRLQRKLTKHTLISLAKIPIGFIQAFWYLIKIKPDVVVSFGGFASFPVVVLAKFFGLPIVIHEQTSVFGLANKVSERLATVVALSRTSSLAHFKNKKTIVTGNPVSYEITSIIPRKSLPKKPTIFITGGSRGSEVINENIYPLISTLTKKYNIVHQVGNLNQHKYKSRLGYEVVGRINPKNWPQYLKMADIIISRAGANIVSEILIAKRPSILIPIPWSYQDEQQENANYAQESGGVKIIKQGDLNQKLLLKTIIYVTDNWKNLFNNMDKFKSEDIKASEKLRELIIDLL